MTRWVVFWVLMGLLAVGAGCDKKQDASGVAENQEQEPEADWELGESEPKERPWTAEELRPAFRAVGAVDGIPDFLSVDFYRAVQPEGPSAAGEGTRLVVEPATIGELKFVGPASLRFVPVDGFEPSTTYRVRLESVETMRGVVQPEKPWTYEFQTPEFKLLGIENVGLDTTSKVKSASMVVRFSARVQVNALRDLASWEVDGRPVQDVTYFDVGAENMIGARLRSDRIAVDRVVRLKLDAGLPYSQDVSAKAGVAEAKLVDAPTVEVFQAVLAEGADGFLIDVICSDGAVKQRDRYYWDPGTDNSYRLSRRCVLKPEDAAESIQFEPPVKFTVAAAENGFRIFGDFSRGTYTMRIKPGARSVDGGMVKQTFERSIAVPARRPTLQFVSRGRYLPRDAWSNLAIRHMNVDEMKVMVRHIPLRNLVFWLSGQGERANSRTSDIVLEEKVALRGTFDTQTTTWLNIGQMLAEPERGVYEILIADVHAKPVESYSSEKTAVDVARLLVTDINLVAKRSAPQPGKPGSARVDVWALAMGTNAPLQDVQIELVRPSGHVVGRCITDVSGGCAVQGADSDVDPTEPFALIATKGQDMTYLKYSDVGLNTDSEPVQGTPYVRETPYHAAVYSDRGVYRPGETAHLVAVVRGRDDRAPKEGLPVELRLQDPRRQEISRTMTTTNAAGMVVLEPSFGDFAATGTYTLEVRVGNHALENYRFNVEEFVPERMRVEVRAGRTDYQVDEAVMAEVKAEYLFGGSAADSNVELRCRLEATKFQPKFNSQLHYGWSAEAPERSAGLDLGAVTGTLNEQGVAQLACPKLNDQTRFQVPGQVVMTASVFEAGSGRTTVGTSRVAYHPEKFYIGLESPKIEVEYGQAFRFSGVVVDWNGTPIKDVSELVLESYTVNQQSNWFYNEETGESEYQRERSLTLEGRQKVAVKNGRFSVDMPGMTNPYAAGVIRLRAGNAMSELEIEQVWVAGAYEDELRGTLSHNASSRTPAPLRPVGLKITGPEEVRVGQPVTVEFEAPFKGRALMTAETNQLEASEWIDVEAGKNTWTFTLGRFVPNVYASALVVKNPYQESAQAFMPERSYGVVSLRVVPQDYVRDVKLTVPEEVRSNSKLNVQLDTGAVAEPTFATVAIVDEGVLQLTRFGTPDLSRSLFERRALGVQTYETVGWAMQMQPGGTTSSTGGGAEADALADPVSRVMPIKPVALWSGVVEVPASGKLELEFEVPQYRGALRVMAVVTGKQRTGRAEAQVVVRDPLTIQTTLPRFLTAHDRAEVPVFVSNLSGKPRTVNVSLEVDELPVRGLVAREQAEAVRMHGSPQRTIRLAEGQSERVVFEFTALRESGAAKFVVRAQADDLESFDELDVPFVPSGPFERRRQAVELEVGVTDLTPYLEGWVPTSERSTIWVTTMPFAGAFDHLKYLVRYPYGCLEQTTSTVRPLLYVSSILQQADPTLATSAGDVDAIVEAGIERIFAMMLPGGGFSYWPGGGDAHSWGTAYATHLLLDARDAGYTVSPQRLEETLSFIEKSLNAGVGQLGGEEAYMQYVLARAGRGRKARLTHLIKELPARLTQVQSEQAYLLKAALYLTGDRRHEKFLKDLDTSAITSQRTTGYSFYSDTRRRAFMLSVFYDLFKNDPAGEPLAQMVAAELSAQQNSAYYTTQELAWGTTALGKWIQGSASNFGEVKLLANGREVAPQVAGAGGGAKSDRTWSLARASEYDRLELQLASKSSGKLYAYIGSEGVRTAGHAPPGGNSLAISREHLNAEGTPIDLDTMQVGEMVFAKISIKNTSKETIYHAVLQDRFPAGWEVENPRLGRGALPEWAQKPRPRSDYDDYSGRNRNEPIAWNVEYMYVRDDRLEAIGTILAGETVELVYALRAVTAGAFTMPPVEVEAMYDARIWAREAGGKARIYGDWSEDVD